MREIRGSVLFAFLPGAERGVEVVKVLVDREREVVVFGRMVDVVEERERARKEDMKGVRRREAVAWEAILAVWGRLMGGELWW